MPLHPVLESLLSVPNMVLARNLAGGFADDDLFATFPSAGTEIIVLLLAIASSVHEVQ